MFERPVGSRTDVFTPAIVDTRLEMLSSHESHIFQSHWGDLTDAFSRAGVGLGMSKYNGWIRVRIDHVLVNDDWHVSRAFVGDDLASDHRPVVADLVLKR